MSSSGQTLIRGVRERILAKPLTVPVFPEPFGGIGLRTFLYLGEWGSGKKRFIVVVVGRSLWTARGIDAECNISEGQVHSDPAGEVVLSTQAPIFPSACLQSLLRAPCVLIRDKDPWGGLESLMGWINGMGECSSLIPRVSNLGELPSLLLRTFPSCFPDACDSRAASFVNSVSMSV